MRDAVLGLLQEHERDGMLPTSIRFVFYELEMRGAARKRRVGGDDSERYVTAAATSLRNDGTVPWNWLVDETRSIESYTGHETVRKGMLARLQYVTVDPWRGSPPLVITESRSLAGVLRHIVHECRASIASTNGACSGFLVTRVAKTVRPGSRVIYLGDLDIAGEDIEEHSRAVLEREVDGDLEWERLALTREQVDQYDLPSIVKRDRRFKGNGGVHEAWECEAISQRILVDTLRARLEELLPEPLSVVHEREERQRRKVAKMLRGETR
jgi:hypothetical protein